MSVSTTFSVDASLAGCRRGFYNLRGRPDAKVELDGARMNVRATVLTGDERGRAWREVTTRHGFFNDYQSAVTRRDRILDLTAR